MLKIIGLIDNLTEISLYNLLPLHSIYMTYHAEFIATNAFVNRKKSQESF